MTRYYQDFVGLNTFIYEPNGGNLFLPNGTIVQDSETISIPTTMGENGLSGKNQNYIGIYAHVDLVGSDPSSISKIHRFKNYNFNYDLPTTASFFNALMSKRGNVYGYPCLLYTSPSPRDRTRSRMPSSA